MYRTFKEAAWIRRDKASPGVRLRLFCLPYAGGGASIYRLWPELFPPDIEVCPIQLPGREGRFCETPFRQMMPLVQELGEILQAFLDIPYAIFGHSLGGLIGFELARSLSSIYSCIPERLFVSACPAPQISRRQAAIHVLPEPDFIKKLAQFHSVPPAFLQDRELLDVFLPLLRSDFALYETYLYAPGEPLACPVSAFYGRNDPNTALQEMAAWRSQTASSFSLQAIPGDHFFIHPQRQLLINRVIADLFPERTLEVEAP